MKIKEVIIEYSKRLEKISDTPRLDVEVLLMEALGIEDRVGLVVNDNQEVEDEGLKRFLSMFSKRLDSMPIAYIINKKEFMGYEFYVDENVLIPRPDTEVVVEGVLERLESIYTKNLKEKDDTRILDMCIGSGAIALSVSRYFSEKRGEGDIDNMKFFGVDVSEEALKVCEKNKNYLGVYNLELIQSDLFSSEKLSDLRKSLDIIVSNPPYIRDDEKENLSADVKDFEPHLALFGGEDGMFFYRKIIDEAREYLKDGGYLIFESGHDQAIEIIDEMKKSGYYDIYTLKDIQGFDRLVGGKI